MSNENLPPEINRDIAENQDILSIEHAHEEALPLAENQDILSIQHAHEEALPLTENQDMLSTEHAHKETLPLAENQDILSTEHLQEDGIEPEPCELLPVTTYPPTVVSSRLGKKYNLTLFHHKKTLLSTHRDLLPDHLLLASLPPSDYLPLKNVTAYNQGSIGSCTANALCVSVRLQLSEDISFDPSRMFLYYVTRDLGHLIGQEGAYLTDAYEAATNYGICGETVWPYHIQIENNRPSSAAYQEAKQNHVTTWGVVTSAPNLINNIKQVLTNKKAVVVGILVYESFESLSTSMTGVVPIPNPQHEGLLGGHAIALVGYDDSKQSFLAINSWGTSWGTSHPVYASEPPARGFCYLPYAYINNPSLCDQCFFFNGFEVTPDPTPTAASSCTLLSLGL